jgi:hypothetical protein
MTCLASLVVALTLATGIPPLTESQRAQLATTVDRTRLLDQAGWYPLMQNAAEWPDAAVAGAAIPDYDALLTNPAVHRGELALIEGLLARAQTITPTRAGPWGQTLTEWVVLVARGETPADDRVAVVYLVDPDGSLAGAPRESQVRAVGRFYQVWRDTDVRGAPTDYLTFVGATGLVVSEPAGRVSRQDVASAAPWWLLIPAVVFLLVALLLVKQMVRPRTSPVHVVARGGRRRVGVGVDDAAAADADEVADPPLPEDPADALVELERRSAAAIVGADGDADVDGEADAAEPADAGRPEPLQ